MSLDLEDTIVAVASASGGAFRGILRISGPSVVRILADAFRPARPLDVNAIRRAVAIPGHLNIKVPQASLPCDVYLWPNERSYTRQPCAEVHTLGSPPLLDAATRRLCAAGARLAEPGEFTLRAFLAGRVDMTQAEAVLGVIDARSRTELDVALEQLAGGLATPLSGLRDQLLDLLAHLEAGLDFVEEDIEFISQNELGERLLSACTGIDGIVQQMRERGESTSDMRLVFAGAPNVGKSSLFNALVGETAANVAATAGTTRDYISCRTTVSGQICLLVDTAGISSQPVRGVEAVAQSIAARQSQQAQVQLFCIDSTRQLSDWELRQIATPDTGQRLFVVTKIDLSRATDFDGESIETSAVTGKGLPQLRTAIGRAIEACRPADTNFVTTTVIRCHESLRLAASAIDRARTVVRDQGGEELVAAELHDALDEIGKVIGAVYTDDVLDRVFSRFCIGK